MRIAERETHEHHRKILSEIFPTLALHDRDQLRTALNHRRRELAAALRLYEEVALHSLPRKALIERTERALTEIAQALNHLDDPRYGTCAGCHRTLRIQTLTLRPLATRCDKCRHANTTA